MTAREEKRWKAGTESGWGEREVRRGGDRREDGKQEQRVGGARGERGSEKGWGRKKSVKMGGSFCFIEF